MLKSPTYAYIPTLVLPEQYTGTEFWRIYDLQIPLGYTLYTAPDFIPARQSGTAICGFFTVDLSVYKEKQIIATEDDATSLRLKARISPFNIVSFTQHKLNVSTPNSVYVPIRFDHNGKRADRKNFNEQWLRPLLSGTLLSELQLPASAYLTNDQSSAPLAQQKETPAAAPSP